LLLRAQAIGAEVVHAVQRRIRPGEDWGVRGRVMGTGVKARSNFRAVQRQGIDVGGTNFFLTIATKVVGPQGVDGDEDYVWVGT